MFDKSTEVGDKSASSPSRSHVAPPTLTKRGVSLFLLAARQSNPSSSHRLNYSAAKSPNQVTNDFDQEELAASEQDFLL